MPFDPDILHQAKQGGVEVSLDDVLDTCDAVHSELSGKASDWLQEELACDRLTLRKMAPHKWRLEPFED